MKLYTNLMKANKAPAKAWSLYVDVECQNCSKNQSLVMYRTNGDKCIRCGAKINV